VVNVYGTRRLCHGPGGIDLPDGLQLGGLATFYDLYQDHLPRLLPLPHRRP
jgi:hypothetical protein